LGKNIIGECPWQSEKMKCPTCGFENPKSYGPCARCGRYLGSFSLTTKPVEATGGKAGTRDVSYAARARDQFSHEDIAKKMKMAYMHGARDQSMRVTESILKLLESLRKKDFSIQGLVNEAAEMIHDQFRLRWVAIGLKNPKDSLFRYDALIGLRPEAAQARRQQAFKLEDFTEDAKYKGRAISEYTKMYFEEDKPYTEGAEITFNRPVLLKSRRHAPEDALEADYLDVHIYGVNNELIGWIECSGTITGKLPDVATMKNLEVIGSIIGAAISRQR